MIAAMNALRFVVTPAARLARVYRYQFPCIIKANSSASSCASSHSASIMKSIPDMRLIRNGQPDKLAAL
jgi:hypothetical protein